MRPWLILFVLAASLVCFLWFTSEPPLSAAPPAALASLDEDSGPIHATSANPGSSIQVEPMPSPSRSSLSQLIAPAPPAITVAGPMQARVGDMPQFTVAFESFTPRAIQWTVDPPVTRMGDDTDRLGIATPVPGQYRINVFAVDEQFRRLETSATLSVATGDIPESPQTAQALAVSWAEDVPQEALDYAIELRTILHDMATLLRQDEITSKRQLEVSFEAALIERLGPQALSAFEPWFVEFNRYLEKLERRGKITVLKDLAPEFDGAADGLPDPPST